MFHCYKQKLNKKMAFQVLLISLEKKREVKQYRDIEIEGKETKKKYTFLMYR